MEVRYAVFLAIAATVVAFAAVDGQMRAYIAKDQLAMLEENIEKAAFSKRCGQIQRVMLTDKVVSIAGRLMHRSHAAKVATYPTEHSVDYYFNASNGVKMRLNNLPRCKDVTYFQHIN